MRLLVIIIVFVSFKLSSQSEQLAKNYFDQGDYEKALSVYQKLSKKQKYNSTFFMGVVRSYQQLEQFENAEQLLKERIAQSPNFPNTYIELGQNYELQGDTVNANTQYQIALDFITTKPNVAYVVGSTLQKYNKLDEAILAYERGMTHNPSANFDIQLARLYGEKGNLERMFNSYLELVKKTPQYRITVNRNIEQYITEDPYYEANVIFRKLLLTKLQQEPNLIYNEMLSWLFIQQKDFKKAFLQEKAIYLRTQESLEDIINVALIAIEEKQNETAKEILDYIIQEARLPETKLRAHQLQLNMAIANAKPKNFKDIEDDFNALYNQYGKGVNTLSIQIAHASFKAFKKQEVDEAITILKSLLNERLSKFQEAGVKMTLADILVLDEKFNQALIYYSQIQNSVKNDELSQEAQFKVAKTSYFKGDFKWSETQLDILKASSSQLIANDALELSLLIKDNSLEDSTQTALKTFAKADLLAFKGQNAQAIAVLDKILKEHKGEKIEDEALLRQAELYELEGNYIQAEANYKKIIQYYSTDILGDNAYFKLAQLYDEILEMPQEAKMHYEKIIFNYADSIFYVEARKRYRNLRGDDIN